MRPYNNARVFSSVTWGVYKHYVSQHLITTHAPYEAFRTAPDDRPHDVAFTERGWTSPPITLPDRGAAQDYVAAVTRLAGPAAAERRTWAVTPCAR